MAFANLSLGSCWWRQIDSCTLILNLQQSVAAHHKTCSNSSMATQSYWLSWAFKKSDAIDNSEGEGKFSRRELAKVPIMLCLSNVKHIKSESLLSSDLVRTGSRVMTPSTRLSLPWSPYGQQYVKYRIFDWKVPVMCRHRPGPALLHTMSLGLLHRKRNHG